MNKFILSFVYAFKGIRVSFKEQRNLKVELGIAILVIFAGLYYEISATEWCFILLTIGLVLALEMVNSSLENLVDFVTLEHNPKAGKIKDVASGAVLIACVIAVIVGVIVFKKYCYADSLFSQNLIRTK